MKNIKTTLAGIGALLTSIGALLHDLSIGNYGNVPAEVTGIIAGVGLLWAKDHNVTGGTIPQ